MASALADRQPANADPVDPDHQNRARDQVCCDSSHRLEKERGLLLWSVHPRGPHVHERRSSAAERCEQRREVAIPRDDDAPVETGPFEDGRVIRFAKAPIPHVNHVQARGRQQLRDSRRQCVVYEQS